MNAFAYINVSDPWIAWLAYRGEMIAYRRINQQAISIWHAKHLIEQGRRGVPSPSFRKELELEEFRSLNNPSAVSRLTPVYTFSRRFRKLNKLRVDGMGTFGLKI